MTRGRPGGRPKQKKRMPSDEINGVGSSSGSSVPSHEGFGDDFAENGNAGGPTYGDDKPIIRWRDGELPRVVDDAEAALIAAREIEVYRRGSLLVRPLRRDAMSLRGSSRPEGSLGIVTLTLPHLVELLTKCAHFE